ncbi:MAG: hypothetical protein NVS3B3_21720 [Aquirhabdus sp.]
MIINISEANMHLSNLVQRAIQGKENETVTNDSLFKLYDCAQI